MATSAIEGQTTMLVRPGAFIGRMQPPHREHIEMIGRLLSRHPRVFIGVTNPEPAAGLRTGLAPHRDGLAGNPFSYDERRQILDLALQAEGVELDAYSIVPFPLERADLWAAQIPADAVHYVRVFSPWEHQKVSLLSDAYDVQVTNDERKHCEGSRVRSALANGLIPEADLHPTTVVALRDLLAQRPYQDRIA